MSQGPDVSPIGPDEAHSDGLDDVVRARLSSRAQLLRAGLLVALVLTVAIGLVWRSGGGFGVGVTIGPHNSTTTRSSTVLVASNVSYGAVTVNGQKQRGPLPVVINLQSGKNTVRFDATPFAPVSCVVVWPQAITSADTPQCALATLSPSRNVSVRGKTMLVGGEITFSLGGSSLSPTECAAALDAIVTSLSSLALTTIVPTGQHIATGDSSQEQVPFDRSAPDGLYARLTPQVESYAGGACNRLIPGAAQPSAQNATALTSFWNVFVPITEDLFFVGQEGANLKPSTSTVGVIQVNLAVPSSGIFGWRVAVVSPTLDRQIEENLCVSGSQVLAAVYHLTYPNGNGYNFNSHASSQAAQGIEGCLLDLDVAADNWEAKATYLWRFGVLMATDKDSHNLLPMLPIASPAELASVPQDR